MTNIKKIMGLAILTSLASKASGFIYQILSLPLIAKALGAEDFGLFLVYSGFSSWLSLLALGLAPTVTSMAANKSREKELPTAFFSSTCLLLFVFTLIAIVLLIIIPYVNSYSILFSPKNTSVFWCAYITFSLNIILSIADAINQGQQRQHVNNVNFAIANTLNIILIYILVFYFPNKSLVLLFLISQVGFILIRIGNSVWVGSRLKLSSSRFSVSFVKEFLKNSGAFIFVQLSVLISQQAIVVLCLEKVGTSLSGEVGLVFRAYALLGSVIAMINQPLWPLINTALSENRVYWVKQLFKKLLISYLIYGMFVMCLLVLLGKNIFELWTAHVYLLNTTDHILIGIHFMLISLSQCCVVMLMGMGLFHQLAKLLMLEAVLGYCAIYLAIDLDVHVDLETVLKYFIFINCLTSFWLLPKKVFASLREISA